MSGAVPELRFPGFEGDWVEKTIGHWLSKVIDYRGKAPPKVEMGIALITARNVRKGFLDFTADEYIDEELYSSWMNRGLPEVNDVLFTTEAPLGNVALYPATGTYALGQRIITLQPDKSKLNSLFLFQYLLGPVGQDAIDKRGTGSTAKGIKSKVFVKIPMATPTLPEQQKIAAFLGAVDGRLAGLRRAETGLVRFKAGLMQRLFSQKLRFKQDDGSAFPDWEEKRLGDLVTWQRNNNLSREFASETEGEVQNIHYGDIHGRFSNLFRQAEADAPFIACHAPIKNFKLEDYCRVGDIIFADASEDHADIGKAIELIEVQDNSIVSGLHTHLARPHADTFALGFVGYMMRVYSVRKQIMTAAQGISVLGISKGNLGAVIVPYPHPDEQRKIAAALSALDAKITATRAQISQTERFKQGLLQQMFV